MFGPHHAEHAEFNPLGSRPESSLNLAVILLRQPFLAQCRGHIKGSIRSRESESQPTVHLLHPVLPTACRPPSFKSRGRPLGSARSIPTRLTGIRPVPHHPSFRSKGGCRAQTSDHCVITACRLIPRRFLQPAFESFSSTITQLTAAAHASDGFAAQILTDTGACQRKIIEILKGRGHNTGLLIDDAIGAETPTTAARKPWIAAGDEVVKDLTGRGNKREIGNLPQPLTIPIEEIGIQQRGQSIQGDLIGLRWLVLSRTPVDHPRRGIDPTSRHPDCCAEPMDG